MEFSTLKVLAGNEMSQCQSRDDKHWGAAWAYYRVAYEIFGRDKAVEISRMIHTCADDKKLPTITNQR